MLTFKVITPSSEHGHSVEAMNKTQLLESWVEGIDFTVLTSGPNAGGGNIVAVGDEVVNSKAAFIETVERLAAQHDTAVQHAMANGEDAPVAEVDVRVIRRMVGG